MRNCSNLFDRQVHLQFIAVSSFLCVKYELAGFSQPECNLVTKIIISYIYLQNVQSNLLS